MAARERQVARTKMVADLQCEEVPEEWTMCERGGKDGLGRQRLRAIPD